MLFKRLYYTFAKKNTMKKIIITLLIISSFSFLKAQLHMGLHTDNYAGIYNINFQPADIVDSRYRFDMNIFQTEFTLANNYIGLKKEALLLIDTSGNYTAFNDPNFQNKFLHENLNGLVKKMYLQSNTQLPFSFYFQFGKKMKNAIGFSSRLRFNTNVDGIEEGFAQQMYSGQNITSLLGVSFKNENLSIQTAAWGELGLTYGREILDLGDHYLKGALTGKLNQGFYSVYAYSDNLDVTFPTDSTTTVNNSDFSYGVSTNLFDLGNTQNSPNPKFEFVPSFSADIGFVYEWRPNIDKYKYEMDGDPDVLDRKKNKYKLKASVALTDMGFIRFKRSPHSKIIHANFNDIENNELSRLVADIGSKGLGSIDSAFNNAPTYLGTTSNPTGSEYLMRLPFKINAMVDYHIWKGFYVNATASIAPTFEKDEQKSIGISQYSLTPRYEHRWAGIQLPISIDGAGRGHLGVGLRAGPFVFGTNDIIPLLAGENYNIYGANFYVGARIPIFARHKDFDKDHVSNKMDNCKKEKGNWESRGCPDSDEDGITDDVDKCPNIKGTLEMNGCPDTDKDGITDKEDDCPEIAGVEEFKGCPDTDLDGIKDSEDKCPEIAGTKELGGCPDSDGDGIIDPNDECPKVAGLKEFKGCPDTDKDGIVDSKDDCPEVFGTLENKGCPEKKVVVPTEKDTDNDGVVDSKDECINTPGPVENKGCPVIKEEVKEVIKTAFQNLEFYSAKSVIKETSYSSLTNLAKILKENPSYKLKIDGHTDSDGSEATNLVLSRKRANAVKTYLKKLGINDNVFIIEAFGETQPVASNNTAEGRQKNRRVEMKIIFD